MPRLQRDLTVRGDLTVERGGSVRRPATTHSFPIAGELQGALADGVAEGLVGGEGVEPFGLRLALVKQEVNQTQRLTLRSQTQAFTASRPILSFGFASTTHCIFFKCKGLLSTCRTDSFCHRYDIGSAIGIGAACKQTRLRDGRPPFTGNHFFDLDAIEEIRKESQDSRGLFRASWIAVALWTFLAFPVLYRHWRNAASTDKRKKSKWDQRTVTKEEPKGEPYPPRSVLSQCKVGNQERTKCLPQKYVQCAVHTSFPPDVDRSRSRHLPFYRPFTNFRS